MLNSAYLGGGKMAVASNGNRILSFGVFEVDMKAGELRRNGARVRLQEQPFQVLTVLLEQPGGVVTREELRNRLWPADTFVDFDHSLNTAIRRLRDALGDSAENPRFVETVARRGYRFLAPVNGGPPPSPVGPLPVQPVHRTLRSWIVAGSLAIVAALALGWWIGTRPRISSAPPAPLLRRLTANPAEAPVLGGVISPDGRYLAFTDKTGFYIRQIATGETHSVPLPDGFNARAAAWFPDGTHLVASWVAAPTEASSLWSVSIVGGTPRKLADDANSPSVSPDGSQIAFLKGSSSFKGRSSQEVWIMQADGSNARRVRAGDGALIGPPAWSPDAKFLLHGVGVYHSGAQFVDAEIQAIDLRTGSSQIVLSTAGLDGYLLWTPDNKLIYIVGERPPNQGDSNLWQVEINPTSLRTIGSPVRLTSDPGFAATLSMTSDGKRLAFFKYSMQPDVYVADLDAAGTRISAPRRLTLDERQDYPFSWTPDGKSVLFNSDRDGTFHLFRQATDRASPDLLAGGSEQLVTPRLTPDGTRILYLVSPKFDQTTTEVRMMQMPLAGGPPQLVLKASGLNNHQCAVSPATTCIYSTIDRHEIRFFAFNPSDGSSEELPQLRRQDDDYYSFNWSLSPDGKTLAMARKTTLEKNATIQLISIAESRATLLPVPGWAFINSIDWASDGASIWVSASTTQDAYALLNVPLNGKPRAVLQDSKMRIGWAIQSRDGRHLALWQASGTANVWMLDQL